MQFPKFRTAAAIAFLLFCSSVWAQEKIDREVEIHRNVKLIQLVPASDIPEDILKQYQAFLPVLEASLKEITEAQSDECALTIRVGSGLKEIGTAKVKRPMARITAFRRNSKQEFLGTLILYSYVTSSPVNKEETSQFLTKQILEPAACRKAE